MRRKTDGDLSRRRLVMAFPASLLGLTLGACDLLGLSWRYRYRLTAEVILDGRLYSGSSVIEVIRTKGYDGIGGEAHGEAVTVDLPGAQTLFLLLRSETFGDDWPIALPHWAFAARLGGHKMADADQIEQLTRMAGQSAELSQDLYPQIVRFKNPSDFRTVENIDPNNPGGSLGLGASLRRVIIEITRDRMTPAIDQKLPPMGQGSGVAEWKRDIPYGDPRNLSRYDFKR